MGSPADINKMIGNYFALMNTIIQYKRHAKPVLWTEIAKFDQLLRTPEGRQWCELHRNVMAALLWKSNTPILLSEAVLFELNQLHSHLADTN